MIGFTIPINKKSLMKANKITIPMFMKLLATKMVASNFLGLSNKVEIILKVFGYSFSPFSKSVLFKEKRDTSAPEISAEHINNTISSAKPKTIVKSIVSRIAYKLVGSGSNYKVFNYTIFA